MQCIVTALRYTVNMARPREHDERTAAALLDAAERIVDDGGLEALSVRHVAAAVGTTTRAVYSLFGSKEGLVAALGTRAFDLLHDALEALPVTDDPGADLAEAGAVVFRQFALSHPALFRLGIQQTAVSSDIVRGFNRARVEALRRLQDRVARLAETGRLGDRDPWHALLEFHALCEGLAAVELRRMFANPAAEQIWRDSFTALVAGWRVTRAPSSP